MRLPHLALLNLVCLIWGLNFVVTKWTLTGAGDFTGVPPFFLAFVRFTLLAAILLPLLRPLPKDLPRVLVTVSCFGAAHFALMFLGLQRATPSTVAIAVQLFAPFTTILSIVFLKERVGWRRWIGIAMAFAGVALIAYEPGDTQITVGVALVACAALVGSTGSILVKTIEPMGPLRFQAWNGAAAILPLLLLTMFLETGQVSATLSGGWPLAAAMVYIVVPVSMLGFGGYYVLLRNYDASLVSPLMLMAPVWGIVFGVLLMGDPFTWKIAVGALLAFAGVAIIAVRSGDHEDDKPREAAA